MLYLELVVLSFDLDAKNLNPAFYTRIQTQSFKSFRKSNSYYFQLMELKKQLFFINLSLHIEDLQLLLVRKQLLFAHLQWFLVQKQWLFVNMQWFPDDSPLQIVKKALHFSAKPLLTHFFDKCHAVYLIERRLPGQNLFQSRFAQT